jgi:abhydrolase domain-containing protein 1/3
MADKFASIHSGYRPTIWCFPSAVNTIVFAVIQRCIKHHYYREILKTRDGGLVAIDWANLGAPKKLILLVLPGLTGSSKDNYVTHLADEAVKAGCTAVVMNYRGIEVELATPRTYCATNFDDLHMVVNHIREKYPNHKIFAVGISLGGIKLGGYIAKMYDDCLISNALIISAPMNVFYSCEELEKTHHFFTFNRHLARSLGRYFSK